MFDSVLEELTGTQKRKPLQELDMKQLAAHLFDLGKQLSGLGRATPLCCNYSLHRLAGLRACGICMWCLINTSLAKHGRHTSVLGEDRVAAGLQVRVRTCRRAIVRSSML